jgi:hypothetical protein
MFRIKQAACVRQPVLLFSQDPFTALGLDDVNITCGITIFIELPFSGKTLKAF